MSVSISSVREASLSYLRISSLQLEKSSGAHCRCVVRQSCFIELGFRALPFEVLSPGSPRFDVICIFVVALDIDFSCLREILLQGIEFSFLCLERTDNFSVQQILEPVPLRELMLICVFVSCSFPLFQGSLKIPAFIYLNRDIIY